VAIAARALQQQLAIRLRQVAPGRVGIDPVCLGDRLEQAPVIHRRSPGPRLERTFGNRERRVRHDQLRVDHALKAEPVALGAATLW